MNICNGTKLWGVASDYHVTFYQTEDEARDQLRRTDRLISFVISELQPEPA